MCSRVLACLTIVWLAAATTAVAQPLQPRTKSAWKPFEPVVRPSVPEVTAADWPINPIDAFVAAEHQRLRLTPRPDAPRHILLRRAYLDLIGLPPTRDELQAFLQDDSCDAYERVVDRLLRDPRYGERWGRHWMDVWRYSDWAGYGKQVRDSQPHVWKWRDWIVESLNQDLGYDQMVQLMLAADELRPTDGSALRATGYLVRNYKLLSREKWMQDTVDHTAQAFLGLTMGCARCHDHMFDSIPQTEYYAMRAIFEPYQVRTDPPLGYLDSTKDGLPRSYDAQGDAPTYLFVRGDDRLPDKDHPLAPGVPELLGVEGFRPEPVALPLAAYYPAFDRKTQQQAIELTQAEVTKARQALNDAPGETAEKSLAAAEAALVAVTVRIAADRARFGDQPRFAADELAAAAALAERQAAIAQADADLSRLKQEQQRARNEIKPDDAKSKQAASAADTKVTEAEKKLADVRAARGKPPEPYTPLGAVYPTTSTGRRAAFARWLTDGRNPLTARVAVNHVWLRHFGAALVESVFDFGQNGKPPSNPALLDWLAAEFMTPSFGPAAASASPWSMKHLHRLIVTSRTYRLASTPDDANLAADPENRHLWRMNSRRMEAEVVRDSVLHVAGRLDCRMGGPDLDETAGLNVNRRSLYFRHAQEKQMEFLKLFDVAAVTECYERKSSIVPQQALALANSELTIFQGRVLARRLDGLFGSDPTTFIQAAFEQVLARPAVDAEIEASVAFLAEQRQLLEAESSRLVDTTKDLADATLPAADTALRARENLVHVLLNHNDFVTIR